MDLFPGVDGGAVAHAVGRLQLWHGDTIGQTDTEQVVPRLYGIKQPVVRWLAGDDR